MKKNNKKLNIILIVIVLLLVCLSIFAGVKVAFADSRITYWNDYARLSYNNEDAFAFDYTEVANEAFEVNSDALTSYNSLPSNTKKKIEKIIAYADYSNYLNSTDVNYFAIQRAIYTTVSPNVTLYNSNVRNLTQSVFDDIMNNCESTIDYTKPDFGSAFLVLDGTSSITATDSKNKLGNWRVRSVDTGLSAVISNNTLTVTGTNSYSSRKVTLENSFPYYTFDENSVGKFGDAKAIVTANSSDTYTYKLIVSNSKKLVSGGLDISLPVKYSNRGFYKLITAPQTLIIDGQNSFNNYLIGVKGDLSNEDVVSVKYNNNQFVMSQNNFNSKVGYTAQQLTDVTYETGLRGERNDISSSEGSFFTAYENADLGSTLDNWGKGAEVNYSALSEVDNGNGNKLTWSELHQQEISSLENASEYGATLKFKSQENNLKGFPYIEVNTNDDTWYNFEHNNLTTIKLVGCWNTGTDATHSTRVYNSDTEIYKNMLPYRANLYSYSGELECRASDEIPFGQWKVGCVYNFDPNDSISVQRAPYIKLGNDFYITTSANNDADRHYDGIRGCIYIPIVNETKKEMYIESTFRNTNYSYGWTTLSGGTSLPFGNDLTFWLNGSIYYTTLTNNKLLVVDGSKRYKVLFDGEEKTFNNYRQVLYSLLMETEKLSIDYGQYFCEINLDNGNRDIYLKGNMYSNLATGSWQGSATLTSVMQKRSDIENDEYSVELFDLIEQDSDLKNYEYYLDIPDEVVITGQKTGTFRIGIKLKNNESIPADLSFNLKLENQTVSKQGAKAYLYKDNKKILATFTPDTDYLSVADSNLNSDEYTYFTINVSTDDDIEKGTYKTDLNVKISPSHFKNDMSEYMFTWDGTIITGLTDLGKTYLSNYNGVLNIPNYATGIGNSAFTASNTGNIITEVNLYNISNIGDSAFASATNLTSVTMSANLASIGNNAFNGCTSLTSVDLRNCTQISSIGNSAFYNTGITELDFKDCKEIRKQDMLEGEDLYLGNGEITSHSRYSGGLAGRVYSGDNTTVYDVLTEDDFNIGVKGFFSNYWGDSAWCGVEVDGEYIGRYSFGWNEQSTLSVHLTEGKHTIRLYQYGDYSPCIDYIKMYPQNDGRGEFVTALKLNSGSLNHTGSITVKLPQDVWMKTDLFSNSNNVSLYLYKYNKDMSETYASQVCSNRTNVSSMHYYDYSQENGVSYGYCEDTNVAEKGWVTDCTQENPYYYISNNRTVGDHTNTNIRHIKENVFTRSCALISYSLKEEMVIEENNNVLFYKDEEGTRYLYDENDDKAGFITNDSIINPSNATQTLIDSGDYSFVIFSDGYERFENGEYSEIVTTLNCDDCKDYFIDLLIYNEIDSVTASDGIIYRNRDGEIYQKGIRYVRVKTGGNTSNAYAHINEIMVNKGNGENVALQKPVSGDTSSHILNDGNTSLGSYAELGYVARNCSEEEAKTVTIDLEYSYVDLDNIKMWRYYDGRSYSPTIVSVSLDGEHWDDIWNSIENESDVEYTETSTGKTFPINYSELINSPILLSYGRAESIINGSILDETRSNHVIVNNEWGTVKRVVYNDGMFVVDSSGNITKAVLNDNNHRLLEIVHSNELSDKFNNLFGYTLTVEFDDVSFVLDPENGPDIEFKDNFDGNLELFSWLFGEEWSADEYTFGSITYTKTGNGEFTVSTPKVSNEAVLETWLSGNKNNGFMFDSEQRNTWVDLTDNHNNGYYMSGTNATWENNSLKFNKDASWGIRNITGSSVKTISVTCKISESFVPVNSGSWFECSTIIGKEMSGGPMDWAIIIDRNGNFAIGHCWSSVTSSNIKANDGKMHTVCGVYKTDGVKLYVDGVLAASNSCSHSGDSIDVFGLGFNNSSNNTRIAGNIYDVKMYTGELSAADIKNIADTDSSIYKVGYLDNNFVVRNINMASELSSKLEEYRNDGFNVVVYNDGIYYLNSTMNNKQINEYFASNKDFNSIGFNNKKISRSDFYDYTPVEYIESTGTQYIDTNFVPNENTRFVVDVNFTYQTPMFMFGSRTYSNDNKNSLNFGKGTNSNNSNYLIYTYGSRYYETSSTGISNLYGGRHVFDANKNKFYVDENLICTISSSFDDNYDTYPLYLFAMSDSYQVSNPPQARWYSKAKLYSTQIYDNNSLARNYIPCLDPNGTACLYDTVEGKYYYNQGTGEFSHGNIAYEEVNAYGNGTIVTTIDHIANSTYYDNITLPTVINCTDGKVYIRANKRITKIEYDNDFDNTNELDIKNIFAALYGSEFNYIEKIHLDDCIYVNSGVKSNNSSDIKIFAEFLLADTVNACDNTEDLYYIKRNIDYSDETLGNFGSDNVYYTEYNDGVVYPSSLTSSQINELFKNNSNYDFVIHNGVTITRNDFYDYTPVEYIESTGTQYIDTGYIPNENTRFVVDALLNYPSSGYTGMGSGYYNSGYKNSLFFCKGNSTNNGNFWWNYGVQSTVLTGKQSYYTERHLFDSNKNVFSVDKNTVITANYESFNSTYNTLPIYLFGTSYANGSSNVEPNNLNSNRLYSSQIYDDNVLTKNFIPCIDPDGTACLYESVEGKYYYNQGSGTFGTGKKLLSKDMNLSDDSEFDINDYDPDMYAYIKYNDGIVYFENRPSTQTSSEINKYFVENSECNTIMYLDETITRSDFYDYTPVEYIESTGTQYIDTLYKHNTSKTKYNMEISVSSTPKTYNAIFGARTDHNSNDAYYVGVVNNTNHTTYTCIGGTKVDPISGFNMNLNTKYNINIDPSKGITVNGTLYGITYSSSTTASFNDYVFGFNYNNSINETINMKLYSFKIYDNDTLVRDYVPCFDSDGTACLYESVEGKYYYNQGTGTFTAGPEA